MPTEGGLAPIPAPPRKPLLGNLLDVDTVAPVQNLMGLARELGPIFRLDMMGKPFTVVWGHELVDELSDQTRFDKSVRGGLHKLREVSRDGLFTAYTSEPNWSRAHNILLPNFGDRAMRGYHPMMLDVAEQMMLKWERLNAEDEVDVSHDMTALTLDTIGLCGFGYRLNSFYRRDYHPFVDAMADALGIAMSTRGLPFEDVTKARQRRMDADGRYMNAVVDRIIRERKAERAAAGGGEKNDLLDYMLTGVDPKTGERLDDTNIRYQIITFLIAGHETTSGLLTFAAYFLLSHPEVLARATEEVDRVFGPDPALRPTLAQVNGLRYVQQVLKESLRLWPTAPGFALMPYRDEVIGGRYALRARSHVLVLLPMLHRDPAVWGERAEIFDPDNFLPEREAARPPNAYKPFGNGQRACIGQQFALQEATLVIGMMLHRFRLIDDHRYALRVKETLTLKPEGLTIKVRRRAPAAANGARATAASAPAVAPASPRANGTAAVAAPPERLPAHGTPLLVLFGSNLGSSEDAARQVADAAAALGFAVTVSWLDDFAGRLPTEGGVLIVCASYNGAPPDNAAGFYRWLKEGLAPGALAGVRYAVFGCGNRNWSSTYQAVPRFLDERLAAFGAERLFARGEGDAREDLDGQFRAWRLALWTAVAKDFGVVFDAAAEAQGRPRYAVELVAPPPANPLAAAHGATALPVLVNRELQAGGERSTRHIEVGLPAGAAYQPGDHLAVVALNPPALVERVAARFGFEPDSYVRLSSSSPRTASLPVGEPVALAELLGRYVELQNVATRAQVELLAEHTRCPQTKPRLLELARDDESETSPYKTEVKRKRLSVLDLLTVFPACELPFALYLGMLPAMTPRYYSISSSPLAAPDRCSITVGVVAEPARSGLGGYEGVCSTHLARRGPGEAVDAFVKESRSGFRLPADPRTPLVMIGPGTGLAPFRGFLQQRRALRERGEALGPARLFFGCRRPDTDFLYRDELEAFAAGGLVELHVAFSRLDGRRTYVQDLVAEQAEAVWADLEAGAVVYVCGDGSRMEPGVRAGLLALHQARTGGGEAAAAAWLDGLIAGERYVLDVWASS